jgi:uncharacterized protein (DUF58 family)
MIAPTPRAVLVFALGVPIALLAVVVDPGLWALSVSYGFLVLAAIATDALLAVPRRALAVEVAAPDRIHIGESGTLAVTIGATRRLRATRFTVLPEQRGPLDPARPGGIDLPAGTAGQGALTVTPRQRGRVFVDALWLGWQGPFALIRHMHRIAVDVAIDVVPNVRGVQTTALQFFSNEAVFGTKTQQQHGEGSEFEALRDFTTGLDRRHIDWKHSARHRKLLCKEFQIERNHQIVFAFDTGYLMREPIGGIPRLDHAINAALRLAWISLRAGDLVGICGFNARIGSYQAPTRGRSSFGAIQHAIAGLSYNTEETNFTLGLAEINVRLRRRALVILFTEFVDTVTAELMIESLQRMANRHVVVLVTLRDGDLQQAVDAEPRDFITLAEAVIAENFQRDRSIVFERLERMGLHCLDVSSAALSVALINRYLLIKQRGLI